MQLNFPDFTKHVIIHADVKQYVKTVLPDSLGLIIMDPPTFSNSKRMEDILDIQKDHVELINDSIRALTPGGIYSSAPTTQNFNWMKIKFRLPK
jgi:23S rRNA (cytosine1962-C5)-methyltransferase